MLIVWHTDRLCMLVISLQFTGIAGRCLECFIGSIAVQIKLVRINRTEIKLIQIFAIVLLCRTFYIPFIMFICAFPVFYFPRTFIFSSEACFEFIVTAIRSNANQVYINRGVLYITTEILKFYCILRRKYNCFLLNFRRCSLFFPHRSRDHIFILDRIIIERIYFIPCDHMNSTCCSVCPVAFHCNRQNLTGFVQHLRDHDLFRNKALFSAG